MTTSNSKLILLALVGCAQLLLTASPVSGQRQSKECAAKIQSAQCAASAAQCLKEIPKALTALIAKLAGQAVPSLNPFEAVKSMFSTLKSGSAMADFMKVLLVPLSEMVSDNIKGAANGDASDVAGTTLVGFFQILLKIVENDKIRNDTNIVKAMNITVPLLRELNKGLECATRSVGGSQQWVLLPMTFFAGLVLRYLQNCFSLIEKQTGWCKFFDLLIPFVLRLAIRFAPVVLDMIG